MGKLSDTANAHSNYSNHLQKKREEARHPAPPPSKVSRKFIPKKLAENIDYLEASGGNIDTFLRDYVGAEPEGYEPYLFQLYRELFGEGNEEYRQAWEAALRLNYRINIDLAKTRAAAKLSKFTNVGTTQSPEISWMKTVLSSELIEGTETSKKKVAKRYGIIGGGPDDADEEEEESLVDQIDKGLEVNE